MHNAVAEPGGAMAFVLNQRAVEHAQKLIRERRFVADCGDVWSAHRVTGAHESAFCLERGFAEYGHWYLALDPDEDEETRAHYVFPYGDFTRAHRCGLRFAASHAADLGCSAVATAARRLHDLIDAANGQLEAER